MPTLFSPNIAVTSAIVIITYIGIAIGRWPIFKTNRATIALIGAGMLLVFNQIKLDQLPGFLDFDTLLLLFSMMVINANLKFAGFFDWAGSAMTRSTGSPRLSARTCQPASRSRTGVLRCCSRMRAPQTPSTNSAA